MVNYVMVKGDTEHHETANFDLPAERAGGRGSSAFGFKNRVSVPVRQAILRKRHPSAFG